MFMKKKILLFSLMVLSGIVCAQPEPPDISVSKTAYTTFTRQYLWSVEKTDDAGVECLQLAPGETYPVNYTVNATMTGYTDMDWNVAGTITVSNATDGPVTVILTDVVSPDIVAPVTCPKSTLQPGESMTCTYSAALPDGSPRTNIASAYVTDGSGNDWTYTASADVIFTTPDFEIDKCITIDDDLIGTLGTVCDFSGTFTYTEYVAGSTDIALCNIQNSITNTVVFYANDTGTSGSDESQVCFVVPCTGCTLTPGYWKTHSEYGPAPYDDTWSLVGEDTPFFNTGQSWYQVLWTPPAGNAYYILAYAYIGAYFNILKGTSSPSEIQVAIIEAELFLSESPTKKWSKAEKSRMTYLANLFDNYNNGLIGPGHCSEMEVELKSAILPQNLQGTSINELNVYPNPFTKSVRIEFVSPESVNARIDLYDMTGRMVKTIFEQPIEGGVSYEADFRPEAEVSGMYFYRVILGEAIYNGKVVFKKE
jgi:hypothetical protein